MEDTFAITAISVPLAAPSLHFSYTSDVKNSGYALNEHQERTREGSESNGNSFSTSSKRNSYTSTASGWEMHTPPPVEKSRVSGEHPSEAAHVAARGDAGGHIAAGTDAPRAADQGLASRAAPGLIPASAAEATIALANMNTATATTGVVGALENVRVTLEGAKACSGEWDAGFAAAGDRPTRRVVPQLSGEDLQHPRGAGEHEADELSPGGGRSDSHPSSPLSSPSRARDGPGDVVVESGPTSPELGGSGRARRRRRNRGRGRITEPVEDLVAVGALARRSRSSTQLPSLLHALLAGQSNLPRRNIYISGLPANFTTDDFRSLCSQFGRVEALKVKIDATCQPSRGYGFALFFSEESASACIRGLHGTFVTGRRLQARYADVGATPQALTIGAHAAAHAAHPSAKTEAHAPTSHPAVNDKVSGRGARLSCEPHGGAGQVSQGVSDSPDTPPRGRRSVDPSSSSGGSGSGAGGAHVFSNDPTLLLDESTTPAAVRRRARARKSTSAEDSLGTPFSNQATSLEASFPQLLPTPTAAFCSPSVPFTFVPATHTPFGVVTSYYAPAAPAPAIGVDPSPFASVTPLGAGGTSAAGVSASAGASAARPTPPPTAPAMVGLPIAAAPVPQRYVFVSHQDLSMGTAPQMGQGYVYVPMNYFSTPQPLSAASAPPSTALLPPPS